RLPELSPAQVAVDRGNVVGEVRLQQVHPPVTIEVAHGQAHPRLRRAVLAVGHAGLDRGVGEGPVVIVPVEDGGRGVAGYVDVGPPVAVEVGRGGGHRVAAGDPRDAGRDRDVAEHATAFVVIEDVRVGGQALG